MQCIVREGEKLCVLISMDEFIGYIASLFMDTFPYVYVTNSQ